LEPEIKPASPPRISLWPLALLGILVSALSLFTSKRNQWSESVSPQDTAAAKSGDSLAQAPIIPNTEPTPTNKKGTDRRKESTPLWKKLIEVGALLVAIGLLIVNICQLRANREALYTVQRAFIIQTKPTTELARYDVINGVRQKEPKKMIEFTHHWENVGNTPAIGLVTAIGKVVQADEITEQEFMMFSHIDQTTAKAALGPRATLDSGTLSDDITFLTDDPESPRFIWGWIVYRDMFPNTKTHVTEFCWKITEITWKLDANGKHTEDKPDLTASACAGHNCVDEFCEDYSSIAKLSPAH
jgi:hypothetical protein